ncbi:MAG TPA: hypothetical protein ENH55_01360 [Aurantimonas coralicida]|uniref:Uncharacterized protein n=2 Tax=root TaxID=1 RepID=A0A9C9NH59_9HYPH|nr:hypothetical protein [Aurantimonas coralicida]HEU01224.1 hypothetical protein [Aurantimonas coralicida]
MATLRTAKRLPAGMVFADEAPSGAEAGEDAPPDNTNDEAIPAFLKMDLVNRSPDKFKRGLRLPFSWAAN